MNKDKLFTGIVILSISLVISSLILANALKGEKQLYGTLTGTLNGSFVDTLPTNGSGNLSSDILQPYDAASLLGYSDFNFFIEDIEKGVLKGIPYTKVRNSYVFSKKALEEWVYNNNANK